MKIAGINGSPNAKGNTGQLIGRVLAGAADTGASTEIFQLGRMTVRPCRACMACKQGGGCVQPDDMQTFLRRAAEFDALVVGTPIYFDHVSAQYKAFFDRLYCFIYPVLENHYPGGRRMVSLITYGDDIPDMYDGVLDWMEERFRFYFGFEIVGRLKKAGCPDRPVVEEDAGLMACAFDLGRQLAGG